MADVALAPVTELVIPEGEFDAYLFDLDGTVADSMPLHYRAWTKAITDAGGQFPEDLFYAWGGVPIERIVELLNEKYGLSMPVSETAHHKEQLYVDLLPELQPMASVVRVMDGMQGKVPFAIVSGSPRSSIESTLARLGLRDRFSLIVGAEDYTHGKPNPEPFLTAAEKLGLAPERCLVFEDAEGGIKSAEAAGMKWVRVERQPDAV
jgi:HAD superfamily hydrolase (TIGR01509 family)